MLHRTAPKKTAIPRAFHKRMSREEWSLPILIGTQSTPAFCGYQSRTAKQKWVSRPLRPTKRDYSQRVCSFVATVRGTIAQIGDGLEERQIVRWTNRCSWIRRRLPCSQRENQDFARYASLVVWRPLRLRRVKQENRPFIAITARQVRQTVRFSQLPFVN